MCILKFVFYNFAFEFPINKFNFKIFSLSPAIRTLLRPAVNKVVIGSLPEINDNILLRSLHLVILTI